MKSQGIQVLRLRQVCALTGLSRSSVYAKLSSRNKYFDSTFPQPFKLGAAAIGWNHAAIQTWLEARIDVESSARKEVPER